MDEKATRERFARSIRSARAAVGITQAELARRTGVNRNLISDYETEARMPAGLMSAAKIAEELGISLDGALGL